MSGRDQLADEFIAAAGWGNAKRAKVPGDASSRRYERLKMGRGSAIFMDSPPAAETPCASPDASDDERRALGYMAMARLAGNNVTAFAGISSSLTQRGFSAPKILACDLKLGFMLLEDLGDDLFAQAIERAPELEPKLYKAAIDMLAALYRCSFIPEFTAYGKTWHVGTYDEMALLAEAELFLEWYAPYIEVKITDAARMQWTQIWRGALTHLSNLPSGLALRDFHAENLFWLPERQAVSRIGLIDFQDAVFSHPAYDLVSLIEDARRDVDPALAVPLQKRFCDKAGIAFDHEFRAAYAVMGAQRNAKILGIFVRLAKRDGKPHYLNMLERVRAHFKKDVSHPALANLKTWLHAHAPGALT